MNFFLNSDKYLYMLNDDNVDRITINLINEIQKYFNEVAPIRKIKVVNDEKIKVSKETQILIDKKNKCYKKNKK